MHAVTLKRATNQSSYETALQDSTGLNSLHHPLKRLGPLKWNEIVRL